MEDPKQKESFEKEYANFLLSELLLDAMSEQEVRGAAFDWAPYDEMARIYDPSALKDGYQTVNGEEIFYISNPALGLWTRE